MELLAIIATGALLIWACYSDSSQRDEEIREIVKEAIEESKN